MSQIVTRKGPVGEDKEKRQTDSPVKEMKKKIAANAEKEKQAAEKHTEKSAQSEKKSEKGSEKVDKPDKADKKDKSDKLDKSIEKKDKTEKGADKKEAEKKEHNVDNKEKTSDKRDKTSDKKEAEEKKEEHKSSKEKDGKSEADEKSKKAEPKAKENGAKVNGEQNGDTVSSEDELQDLEAEEKDEMFPELAYEDSDGECFEPPTPEGLPSRSYTRRSQAEIDEELKKTEPKVEENGAKVYGEQNGDTVSSEDELQDMEPEENDDMFPELVYEDSDWECFELVIPQLPTQVKATRTPETPRPASEKHADKDYVPDDSKLLKLKEDLPASDRKLRSSDSPKPQEKKTEKVQETNQSDSTKAPIPVVVLEETKVQDESEKGKEKEKEIIEVEDTTETEIEVVVEVENEDEARAKTDTNYSKSRVKVSPYRRSARLADTDTSMLANYTGNNTTMEMDITETSSFISEEPLSESPYLSGLRSIRGRRSYKPLKEMTLRNLAFNRSTRSNTSVNVTEHPIRPTGTVVGRKRKPSNEEAVETATEVEETVRSKRARLLERLAKPFRMASTPLPARRAAEIVGINTDLPLTAPVASTEPFDPEAIKPPTTTPIEPPAPINPNPAERDSKRCVVM